MSGFIWSALGNAVANSGSSIAGAMMRDIEDQRRVEAEDRREASALRRMEEADRLKSERERAAAEELQQRIIRDQAATKTRAGEIARARDEQQLEEAAARLAAASSSVAGDSPATSAEQFKEMLRKDPSLRDQFSKTGLVGRNLTAQEREFQDAKDLGDAAMAVGAHSSVISAYSKLRSDVLDKIKEENRDAAARRRDDRADAREERLGQQFTQTLAVMQQNADSNRIRAERPPSGGTDPNKPATTADLQRQITAAQTSLALELGVSKNDVNAEVASLKRKADKGDARAKERLDTVQPFLDELKDANDRMMQFKRNKPGSNTPSPAPAPSNNPGQSGTRNYSNLWN